MCESASHQGDLPALFAAEEVVGGAGAVLLEQPVTNAMFRPVRGQARRFGFVKDFDSVVDFIDAGELRLFECLLESSVPVECVAGLE